MNTTAFEYGQMTGKFIRAMRWPAVALAVLTGTYAHNDGRIPPVLSNKVGTSYGINIGVNTRFAPGSKFYGLNIACYTTFDSAEFNGVSLSIVNTTDSDKPSTLSGLIAGLDNTPCNTLHKEFDPEHDYLPPKVNGLQIGIANGAREGHYMQIGGFNYGEKEGARRASIGVGLGYE